MWGCNWGAPFPYSFVGILVNILMVVTIVYIVVLTVRSLLSRNKGNKDTVDSLDIVKQKYARGEISEKEYLRIKDILIS